MKLTDNIILIAGGASGIGFALARQFSERSNRVIVCGRSAEALSKAQTQVPALITKVHRAPQVRSALAAIRGRSVQTSET